MLLDEIVDAALSELSFSPDAGWTVRSAKFVRQVRPGDCLDIRLSPAGSSALRFECSVDGEIAASGALAQQPKVRE